MIKFKSKYQKLITLFNKLIPKTLKKRIKKSYSLRLIERFIENPFDFIIIIKKSLFANINKKLDDLNYKFARPRLKWLNINIEGYLRFVEAKVLYKIAKKLPENSTFVEIGAYLGRSTCFILEGLKRKKNIKFYTIDSFENQTMPEGLRDTYADFTKNTTPYKDRIIIKQGFSYNVVKDFPATQIEVLWIDGDHAYESVKKDIDDWLPLVKKKGKIIFHDYDVLHIGVVKAVNAKFKEKKLKKLNLVETLIVTQKISD